ncbi:MAG: indolepyruvate ferredoxin oxidoreductase subunit alpha [Brevinema sp.]
MPHFIDETCINCAACEAVCPVVCISEKNGARFIDESLCIDCASCVAVCPVDAIHMH